MKRTFVTVTIALSVFAVISFFRLPFSDRLTEIAYGICGILFSVGMSQMMTFDFSKIVSKGVYEKMTQSLKTVRVSFVVQFILASIAFVIFQALKSESFAGLPFYIQGRQFSFEIFLSLIIIYSLFFFLYNFHLLSNKKAALDKIIRDEQAEDTE